MTTLAEITGVPTSTISRIESGKLDPTFSMLSRIVAAAGYTLDARLWQAGGDQVFADYLRRIADLKIEEQPIKTLLSVASSSPVSKRNGAMRYELDGSLTTLLYNLDIQGQNPVVSSLEAYSGNASDIQSFTPIVYVNNPSEFTDLSTATPHSNRVVFLLPITNNVRSNSRRKSKATMVSSEWGLLDALASPGRQPDAALEVMAAKAASL